MIEDLCEFDKEYFSLSIAVFLVKDVYIYYYFHKKQFKQIRFWSSIKNVKNETIVFHSAKTVLQIGEGVFRF